MYAGVAPEISYDNVAQVRLEPDHLYEIEPDQRRYTKRLQHPESADTDEDQPEYSYASARSATKTLPDYELASYSRADEDAAADDGEGAEYEMASNPYEIASSVRSKGNRVLLLDASEECG